MLVFQGVIVDGEQDLAGVSASVCAACAQIELTCADPMTGAGGCRRARWLRLYTGLAWRLLLLQTGTAAGHSQGRSPGAGPRSWPEANHPNKAHEQPSLVCARPSHKPTNC
jgi:hypothetical protein